MKKIFMLLGAGAFAGTSFSQYTTFEEMTLGTESAYYGQDQVTDGDTVFEAGVFNFETNYNSSWGSFAGWAVSNVTDNVTPGWSNQFSAIPGEGFNGSANYGICYVSSWESNRVFNTFGMSVPVDYCYVTNTTYAYYSMLNGDDFTKPFGADTNAQGVIDGTNGEDWFLLTIYGLGDDSLRTGDSVNFYLADYRFSNDADDFIIDAWTLVDLSNLGPVLGIEFELSSSDTSGGWGMNNPAYFAMDDLGSYFNLHESNQGELSVYPNPTNGTVQITTQADSEILIYTLHGELIYANQSDDASTSLDLTHLESGVYLIYAKSMNGQYVQKLVIQH